jgi:hypothetical protein
MIRNAYYLAMTEAAAPTFKYQHILSRTLRAEGPEALAAALGFAGPIALGLAAGHVGAGLAAATGALMAGGGTEPPAAAGPRSLSTIALALLAPVLAASAAQALAGHGWLIGAAITLLAILAALIGGFSRPLAVITTRFTIFMIIALGVAGNSGAAHGSGAVLMIATGAGLMTVLLRLARRLSPPPAAGEVEAEAGRPSVSLPRRLAWFGRQLKTSAAWSYPLRLGLALAVAEAADALWPDQHLRWIALTVVLLTTRRAEPGQNRIRDRAVGTALGVLVAGLMLLWRPSPWELVGGVALIAGARPFLRARSYMAYSVAMTPLIMLLQDFSTPPHIGLLADRLGATLAGAALVMVGARLLPPPPPQGPRHERARPSAA